MKLQIKTNQPFIYLAKETGMSQRVLDDKIIGSLWGINAIREEPFYLGMTVNDLLDEIKFSKKEFVESILGEVNVLALNLMSLTIVGSNDEDKCPDCGSDVEITNDGAFGFVWEEHYCQNEHCDYFTTTEPDWELL